MSDEFLTQGLEGDRYLKAVKLVDRFETELRHELKRIGNETVDENPALFPKGVDPKWNNHVSSSGGVLAFGRFDYRMDRENPSTGDRLKLNYAFRWVEPGIVGHEGNGPLTFISYTIKNAPDEDYRKVIEATRGGEGDVSVGDDPYGKYPATFYVPVGDADGLKSGGEALKKHFSGFGSNFGV